MLKISEPGHKGNWQTAWQSKSFRNLTKAGSAALIAIFCFFPFFFKSIEKRNGTVLNDWLLNIIPSHDASISIFIFVWAITLLLIIRMVQQPNIFIVMLWAYVIMSILRVGSITFTALNAPVGFIELVDPVVSNIFYRHTLISKDLFFSGHTSTAFLMFLCLTKKSDKIFAFVGTLVIASLLLLQHVHYSVDILAAPVFAFISYLISKKIISRVSNSEFRVENSNH